jgi:hypothetical protein
MDVLFMISMLMMMAMRGCPPERTALSRRVSQNCEQKLPGSRGVKCLMRKIAMIKTGNCKHPEKVERNGCNDRRRTPSDK